MIASSKFIPAQAARKENVRATVAYSLSVLQVDFVFNHNIFQITPVVQVHRATIPAYYRLQPLAISTKTALLT
jgi:hypothetical protein